MDVRDPLEKAMVSERKYNQSLDLCPLEHILIGSSVFLTKDEILNLDTLRKDTTSSSLLMPAGLINGERLAEDTVKARAEKKHLSGWIVCFKPILELISKYSFDYILNQPDDNNMIPNRFEFRFRKNDSKDSVLTDEDVSAFRTIELAEGFRELFRLTRDENKGIFTITYLPFQEKLDK